MGNGGNTQGMSRQVGGKHVSYQHISTIRTSESVRIIIDLTLQMAELNT
jgi:hypothetical protein